MFTCINIADLAFRLKIVVALILIARADGIAVELDQPLNSGERLPATIPATESNRSTTNRIAFDNFKLQESFSIAKDGAPILVPVQLAGKTYQFLLDTGCSFHVFDSSLKDDLGKSIGSETVKTAGEPILVELFDCPTAHVGKLPLCTVDTVACLDLKTMRQRTGTEIRGIIGMPFLEQYIVQVDFDLGRVVLLAPSTDPSAQWGSAIPVKYNKFTGPMIEGVLPGGIPRSFMVDTGLNATGTLAKHSFKKLVTMNGLKVTNQITAHTSGGMKACQIGRLDEFAVASFKHEDLIFSDGSSDLIGRAYLARYLVTFDIPRRRIYLRQGKLYASVDARDGSGLTLLRKDGQIIVDSVDAGSPGELAGIRANDIVSAIANRCAADCDLFSVRRLLRPGDKSDVVMTIVRGESTMDVTFRLDR